MQDHDVVVATGRGNWEFACLIRIGLSKVVGGHERNEEVVGELVAGFLGWGEVQGCLHVECRGEWLGRFYVLLLHP